MHIYNACILRLIMLKLQYKLCCVKGVCVMCDVIFITPNMSGDIRGEVLGILQLATILKQKDISCDILHFFRIGDISSLDSFIDNAIKLLEVQRPKIVSFYTRCDTYHIDIKLAEQIKNHWPDVYIVFGGPQSDITATEAIEQLPFLDFVCCGEGENTIYPFFSSLLRNQPDFSIPGLVYRYQGKAIKNPRPALIQDLDSLPLIDYSLFQFTDIDNHSFPIDVGRGCPFGCTYCSTKTFWGRKYRLKSPERILQEVQTVYERFGVTRFSFDHDMFTLNRSQIINTCHLLRSLDFPITWNCSARLDCIDKELIDIMADSGMKSIYIGIETGSPRMQKLIRKNLKLDNALETLAYLKDKGIRITTSFIYGFPEETEEDLSQTIALIRDLMQLRIHNIQTHLCTFLAGTELTERFLPEMTRTSQSSDVAGNLATGACEDVFSAYPDLFAHMYEYKTELRGKLRYFKLFFRIWKRTQPVYHYISEKYSPERLIDMYYDFVQANKAFLNQIDDVEDSKWVTPLLQADRLPECFADDCNYDLISDYCRMNMIKESEILKNGGIITDAFCFSPAERKTHKRLQDYKRSFTLVTCQKDENGKIVFTHASDGSF